MAPASHFGSTYLAQHVDSGVMVETCEVESDYIFSLRVSKAHHTL